MRMDLNCDVGELPEALADGTQEAILRQVTSANIACGGHAGDPLMMRATIEQAQRCGTAIGAHPGYEDRANLGRIELTLSGDEVAASVYRQILALAEVAGQCGARIGHVKPHGALYNQAARDREIARAIAEGVTRWRRDVVLVGLAGSVMLQEFRAAGFAVAAEGFADRKYEGDGSLRRRKFRDALLHDPAEAAAQAVRIAREGSVVAANGAVIPLKVETICIHGDTPGAARIAEAVRRALEQAGITLRALGE
ncbi:MAG TPA: 5-oxoprolinase subunit PxpA [Candidatus Acidoferrum sp.]|nr:5-oxoprolinase subunit PxpA [Candidatus Acidoferrum sp.]